MSVERNVPSPAVHADLGRDGAAPSATAGFEARYQSPLLVFGAATSALCAVAALAVLIGNRAGRLLDPRVTQRVAAGLFAVVGIVLLVSAR